MKAWVVGRYDDEWAAIVHADTRAKARMKGMGIGFDEFISIYARRLPNMDDKVPTVDLMIEAGWPEDDEWLGGKLDLIGYILDCGCGLCREAIRRAKEGQWA
jgi:hypothetical protein